MALIYLSITFGCVFIICVCKPLGPGPGTCTYSDPSNGELIYRCCANHHYVNGACTVCPSGYIGSKGLCDIKCPQGTFGSLCTKTCECEATLCHHIDGCTCNATMSLTDCYPATTSVFTTMVKTNKTSSQTDRFSGTFKPIAWLKISIITSSVVLCFTTLVVTSSYFFWHWYFLFHQK